MAHAANVLERIRHKCQQHGVLNTAQEALIKGANRVTPTKVLCGVLLERVAPAFLEIPPGYTGGFLTPEQLSAYAEDPANEMPADFLADALGKGDLCYGLLYGGQLAAYGWYSRKPTRIDPPHLVLHFSDDYVYMYKGYTHPEHRGKRLHAIGMNLALKHFLEQGQKGLISYVESQNFDSLKSVFRLGYEQFGTVYLTELFHRQLTLYSGRCHALGFHIEAT